MDEPDFIGALNEEFGLTPEPDEPKKPEPTSDEGGKGGSEDEPAPKAGTEEQVPSDKDEPADSQGADAKGVDSEAKSKEEQQPEAPEAPKYATKDDVLDAMREYNQATAERVERLHTARNQVIENLYPEGVDTNLYDSNGELIKTAQDIVDRGLVKENGEPFTYEEAASFVLQAQQQMAKNIEELNNWADDIADKNISLIESNQRVVEKWGETLKAMPQLAERLTQQYLKEYLEFDKTGSFATNVRLSPEVFFDRALEPYIQLAQSMARQEQLEAQIRERDEQNEQDERMGIPPQRGQSQMKSNTGDANLDALIDELAKA